MRLYLPGPHGDDHDATADALRHRGYYVASAGGIRKRGYRYNDGCVATESQAKRMELQELAECDVIVLHDEMARPEALHLLRMAHRHGLRVALLSDLPAVCPSVMVEDVVMNELDITQQPDTPFGEQLRNTWQHVQEWWAQVAAAFDRRFGWFFTNGNKQQRQPTPVPYKLNTNPTTTTA